MMAPQAGSPAPIVVAIGASAGGLEAFSQLLASLPEHTGMAFVLLQHLDPTHPSLLTQLLSTKTTMPVAEATEGIRVSADRVYVVPAAVDLLIEGGRLRLTEREQDGRLHLPIDRFLCALAADAGERAIGVVLSGAASDGVRGLVAIKSSGGMTFAQDPSSAEYPSMPASAIAAGAVDFVLSPQKIALELARLAGGAAVSDSVLSPPDGGEEAVALGEIFALLRGAFRVDFSAYKLPTIRRRIARRMLVRRVADLQRYVELMAEDSGEVEALYRDILIMVTEFFREPETFAVLRERVFPAMLQDKAQNAGVRVWVPGCASGEEVYSLAITLLDVMDARGLDIPVKLFATDISEPDLTTARRGLYPENVAAALTADLLRRYFVHEEGGYRIVKAVRELCVFARHDVTSDPPFADLDLVSCRNLLIYLGSGLQRRVIPNLHYGLRRDGYLILGRSESIAGFSELFETVDKKQKIFKKLASSAGGPYVFPAMLRGERSRERRPAETEASASPSLPLAREADKAVLAGFAPAGVTVDAQFVIVEFRGDTDPYLRNRPGRPSLNLFDMVRDELRGKLRVVLTEAGRTGNAAVLRSVPLRKGRSGRIIDLHVIPFATKAGEAHFVVLFGETSATAGRGGRAKRAPKQGDRPSETDRLRDELNETRERLEAVIQDKEAANEGLRAANEEMLSGGEEMQSINEELETTQEELQSTNQELRSRNVELGQVSDDLSNLLTSVSFPIIMVGRDLRIRRFTPAAERLFKVIPSDVGRLITDLKLRVDVPDLEELLGDVIDTMTLKERDVQGDDGRWYAMQVRPYVTLDNRIDGAVMTLFDIDEMKRMLAAEKSIATVMQQHYIHAMPEIAGLEMALVAETAHDRDLVGGDFHDVFRLPDGQVLVLIGDVAGKGVQAAGLAETVRIAARTAALAVPSPDQILRLTHQLLGEDSEQFVTALVVTLDPFSGEGLLASAGHLPPVHVSEAGSCMLEPEYGRPLGSLASAYPARHFSLAHGDTLVLYTDGLTEARRDGELFGEERLVDVLCGDGPRDPHALVQRARDAVVAFAGELKDDLQILAIRLV
jgi:two-component system, chemotaxis family, CheB/CheR fusion protein